MAYNEVWDETAPLDTALASTLGSVLRNLKTDIHQRVVMAGTLANRPTPEAVFSVAGSGISVGALYFATDTGQVFQFTAAATWTDVTPIFIGKTVSRLAAANILNVAQGTFFVTFTTSVPLAPLKRFRIRTALRAGFTGNSTITLRLSVTDSANTPYYLGDGGSTIDVVMTLNNGQCNVEVNADLDTATPANGSTSTLVWLNQLAGPATLNGYNSIITGGPDQTLALKISWRLVAAAVPVLAFTMGPIIVDLIYN